MPKKVSKTNKKAVSSKKITAITEKIEAKEAELTTTKSSNTKFVLKLAVIALIGIGAYLVALKYKGAFIAGSVGNSYVTKYELNQRLNQRYGAATLDEIISEKILFEQAKKNDISVSDDDIKAEVTVNENQFGGKEQLMAMAKQAGINDEKQLNDFFKLKLTITKLQEKLFPSEVTDEEVQKYFDDNKDYYQGKKLEEVKDDIVTALKSQKAQTDFSTWFEQVRTESQVNSYL